MEKFKAVTAFDAAYSFVGKLNLLPLYERTAGEFAGLLPDECYSYLSQLPEFRQLVEILVAEGKQYGHFPSVENMMREVAYSIHSTAPRDYGTPWCSKHPMKDMCLNTFEAGIARAFGMKLHFTGYFKDEDSDAEEEEEEEEGYSETYFDTWEDEVKEDYRTGIAY